MTDDAFYQAAPPGERVGRGDIALLYLPQSRTAGEQDPPETAPRRRVDVPAYAGSFRLADPERLPGHEIQVWPALAVVVMDSCELDRYFNQQRSQEFWDSRVAVGPLVFEPQYPHGPWERMARGQT